MGGTPNTVIAAINGGGGLRVGTVVCKAVSIRHLLALDALRSPFVTPSRPRDEGMLYESARALVVLSADPVNVPGLVFEAERDPARFDAKVWALIDQIGFADVESLGDKISAHLDAPFALALKGGESEDPSPRAASDSQPAAR
jgi:hypothetical protein